MKQINKLKPAFSLNIKFAELSFKRPKVFVPAWLLVVFAAVVSVITTFVFFKLDLIVAYNDARAHMNMSRLVIDNLKPGLAQIGSVWLPLNHILTLTLVWNDWLWKTGLAGAVFSMLGYVLAIAILFKLIKAMTKDTVAAILGVLVFATNLNVLYMQSTPMTELPLLLFFIAVTYFLYQWVTSKKLTDLLLVTASVFFATLTRYDGWFLFVIIFGIVGLVSGIELVSSKATFVTKLKNVFKNRSSVEGKLILYLTLAGFGIVLWLLWNLVIFGDPLYFAFGPYSAHAQQIRIEEAGALPTKFNLPLSLAAYWWAMVNNAGFLLLIFAIIGFVVYAIKHKLSLKAIAIYTLLVPLFFHVISLYVGHSILVLPELGVSITEEARASWFNVRYGLMMLPAIAFFSAHLAAKDKLAKIVLLLLIVLQPIIFLRSNNIITITDGVQGTSSLNVGDVSDWLVDNAGEDESELILASISFHNALAFSTGMPLKRFIHEGTGYYWEESLVDPSIHARWIVMANGDVGDLVYDALIKEGNSAFLKRYSLRARFKHINIYERRGIPSDFVYVEGREFKINGESFRFVGANSYDLIYRTPAEVSETLSKAKEAGIDVVRLWAFGDGFLNGIQPSPGDLNENRLRALDKAIAAAKQHDIKLIITFVNYWRDYGGVAQYLKWAGLPSETTQDLDQFYTSSETRQMYKDYVEEILTRKNIVTGVSYIDEPTVFAWELMNEPRSASRLSSPIVINWMQIMANHISSLDRSHMILAGHEGFVQGSDYTPTQVGPLVTEVSELSQFDALSGHYYLQDVSNISSSFTHPIVSVWKRYSDFSDKPLLIEEVGFSKDAEDNGGVSREILYRNLFEEAVGHGIQGVMVWNWALLVDDNYGISPRDPGDEELIQLIKTYSERIKI